MVADERKLLYGWRYPIYTDTKNQKICDTLMKEGVAPELIKPIDYSNIENFCFIARVSQPRSETLEIVMTTRVERVEAEKRTSPPHSIGTYSMHTVTIKAIPLTNEEWYRALGL